MILLSDPRSRNNKRYYRIRFNQTDGLKNWQVGSVWWQRRPDIPRVPLPDFPIPLYHETIVAAKARQSLGSASSCVYCGATRFNAHRVDLSEEHVISEAFGAALVLDKASCESCNAATSGIESKIVAGMLDPSRKHLDIRGKNPTIRKNRFKLMAHDAGSDYELLIPSELHPTVLFLPLLLPPGKMWRNDPLPFEGMEGFWAMNVNAHPGTLSKAEFRSFSTPVIDTVTFCQFLAKIAHGFAVSKLGDTFIPYHREFIRRKFAKDETDQRRYHLIGGSITDEEPTSNLHELALSSGTIDDVTHYLVRIRLFAKLGAPVYLVLVGQRLFG
ncbi:HNH endonuclease [Mesorhizobium sp. B2-6-2]|nr:HNH endonuclease [Mesorhizobium sp. B2-6-2]